MNKDKTIHCVGIADPVVCDIAIKLHREGYHVTGSTDTIWPPSQRKLSILGLWPQQLGWLPDQITRDIIDTALVGNKIQPDNPELQRIRQVHLPHCACNSYLAARLSDRQRVAVVASPISKLICTMAIRILRYWGRPVDYIVDTAGLESVVQLTHAPLCVVEETSWPTPVVWERFTARSIIYMHHILLIPPYKLARGTMELSEYSAKLRDMIEDSEKGSTIIYADDNSYVDGNSIEEMIREQKGVTGFPYRAHSHYYVDDELYIITPHGDMSLGSIDESKLHVLSAVRELLYHVGITYEQFYQSLADSFDFLILG